MTEPTTEAGRRLAIASDQLTDQLAFALPALVAAWDNGETDNAELAALILRLVRPAIEAEAREQELTRMLGSSALDLAKAEARADERRIVSEEVRPLTEAAMRMARNMARADERRRAEARVSDIPPWEFSFSACIAAIREEAANPDYDRTILHPLGSDRFEHIVSHDEEAAK